MPLPCNNDDTLKNMMYKTKGTQTYIDYRFKNKILNNKDFLKIYSLNKNDIYEILSHDNIITLNFIDWYVLKTMNINYEVLIDTFFPTCYDEIFKNQNGYSNTKSYDMSLYILSEYVNTNLKLNCVPEYGKFILSFDHNCKFYKPESNFSFLTIISKFYF